MVFVTPNERATEALRVFIEGHMEYMKTKSHENGPLKLIHYSFSESPEWSDNSRWHTGETPGTTERRVFHLFEILFNALFLNKSASLIYLRTISTDL